MQRLGAAQNRGHGLDGGTDDVVVRILLGERPTGGLDMGPQHGGLRFLRVELLHELVPQIAGSPQHGDFHEEVHAHAEEEGKARGKGVDVHAGLERSANILDAVSQGKGALEHGVGTGFHDVVAADADRVVLRHVLRAEGHDVGHDPHGGLGRIDVGVPGQVLFEDVVLDGALQLLLLDALLLGGPDPHGQNRDNGAVHGHGDGHLVQRDAVEEDLHVLDGVDGHAGLADVTGNTGVVRVVTAVGGKAESYRQTLLTGGQVFAVELVGSLGSGETGILTDGPGAAGVHGGHRPAGVGGHAREHAEGLEPLEVLVTVHALDGDAFGRLPVQRVRGFPLHLLARHFYPLLITCCHNLCSLWLLEGNFPG